MKVFFKIEVTQASFKEAGTADSAMDLLIMSAMIGAIVPGSFFIIHVGTGSKPTLGRRLTFTGISLYMCDVLHYD